MGFFDFFKKKKTIIEEIEDITIKAYRTIGAYNV